MASTSGGSGDDSGSGREASIIACAVVMLVLSASTVAIRFYTRWAILGFLGPDDWLIFVALVIMSRL